MQSIKSWYLRRVQPAQLLHVSSDTGGDGPVIVFLHGIASSSMTWNQLLAHLPDGYRAIRIDLLGSGHSPKPEWSDYTIDHHVRSIKKTLSSLRITGNFSIVGHSLGALLACRLAVEHEKSIDRLILLSPPIYLHVTQHSDIRTKRFTNGYLQFYKYIRSHKKLTITNAARASKYLAKYIQFDLREETWRPFILTLEHCIENQTTVTDVGHIKKPIDIFYGTRDQLLLKKNIQLLGSMRHVHIHPIKGAGHVIRSKTAETISNFIEKTIPLD